MKKQKKTELIAIAVGVAELVTGCLIGGFWGGAFVGAGVVFLVTYTVGKYLYEKSERRHNQVINNIINFQNDIRDAADND